MAFSFADLVDAIETYPASFIEIEVIDVEFPGDALNVGDEGTFKVKVTNNGALNLDNVTLKVAGANGALVNEGGLIPSGQTRDFVPDFVSDELDRLNGHGGTQTFPAVFPFVFLAPNKASDTAEDLVVVTLEGWNGNQDHMYLVHSKGDAAVSDSIHRKVVRK